MSDTTWTKDVPQKPGLYWVFMDNSIDVLRIEEDEFTDGVPAVSEIGSDLRRPLSKYRKFWWLGPMPMPPKPEISK